MSWGRIRNVEPRKGRVQNVMRVSRSRGPDGRRQAEVSRVSRARRISPRQRKRAGMVFREADSHSED